MITVSVGDQDRIERPKVIDNRYGHTTPNVEDPAAEKRVSQQSDADKLDEYSCMPDVGERAFVGRH
jgi:hypothetical protein